VTLEADCHIRPREDHAMTELTLDAAPQVERTGRHIVFRILAAAIAALLLFGFGVWMSILTPWVLLADETDHGWTRTPELHRLADSASAGLMAALGAAAIVLAIRPRGHSAVTAWLLGVLALFGLSSFVSSAIQGQDLVAAAVFLPIWLVLAVGVPWFFAPSRATLVRGGASAIDAPGRVLRVVFGVGIAAGLALAIGAVVWRLAGGLFEDPHEDDVLGFVLLGLAVALGGTLCLCARAGWRTLAVILACLGGYSVVGVASIASSGAL
jgi:hypothetical protein